MLPEVNLLPKYERQNSILYIVFIIGLAFCLLLFAVLLFFYFQAKGNLAEAKEDLEQFNEEKSLLEAQLAPVKDETESFEIAFSFAEHHIVPTSDLIDELIEQLPVNGYLKEYNYSDQTVEIETQFEQMSDAAAYVTALNRSDFIKNVEVNEISTVELAQDDDEDEDLYTVIPRYQVFYTILVDQAFLKEGAEVNE